MQHDREYNHRVHTGRDEHTPGGGDPPTGTAHCGPHFDQIQANFLDRAQAEDAAIIHCTADAEMPRAFRFEIERIIEERDILAAAHYLGRWAIERIRGLRGPEVGPEEFRAVMGDVVRIATVPADYKRLEINRTRRCTIAARPSNASKFRSYSEVQTQPSLFENVIVTG